MIEDDLEKLCISWFEELGWTFRGSEELSPTASNSERQRYSEVLLSETLEEALRKNNPKASNETISKALKAIQDLSFSDKKIIEANEEFYEILRNGIPVEINENNDVRAIRINVFDWDNPFNNDWTITNQFTVKQVGTSRPDMVAFINGLPLIVIELKNPADLHTDVWKAYNQIQSYKTSIPRIFNTNLANIISDGVVARYGSVTANEDWHTPWRIAEGIDDYKKHLELEVVVRGLCNRNTLLNYFKHFVAYKKEGGQTYKVIAGYHQFFGVRQAVKRAINAATHKKDGKGGVVWFTQGSGKSFLALFYAAMLREQPELNNPTIVVVTDRNDLDGQLYEDFATCPIPMSTTPVQANSREHLKELLSQQKAGGVFFTTIQRFPPVDPNQQAEPLCDRENVIVICDEAHRTQYGFTASMNSKTGQLRYGLATYMRQALPNAVYLGLTGTPIDDGDRDTEAVFGSYIDIIYDVKSSQEDGNTVPLLYEPRIINLAVTDKNELEKLNDELNALEPDADEETQNKTATRLTRLESIAMADGRLRLLAEDLLSHWEKRKETQKGKAIVVAMSRKTAVALYDEIVAIKREQGDDTWHSSDLNEGKIKIIMTSSASDAGSLRDHATSKKDKEHLKRRIKDESDELEIIIVRDMWLTGTNIPILNTMYVDKPMKGHDLMQAIARINRVWRDKPGGLIVDYIGIGEELKKAIANYTRHKGTGKPVENIEQAVTILVDTMKSLEDFMHKFNFTGFEEPIKALQLLPSAIDYVLTADPEIVDGVNRGVKRFMDMVVRATKAQALAGTHEKALAVRNELAFFQAVRAGMVKYTRTGNQLDQAQKEAAMRQIVAKGVLVDGVTDLYKTLGFDKPDISLLSPEFLQEIQSLPQKNFAAELLQKLLNNEIKSRARKNKTQGKKFSQRLEEAIQRYQNRAITSAEVIKSLIDMAKDMMNETPPDDMTEEEFAFYQALSENESAVAELGDPTLKALAAELTDKLRKSATVDWQHRETARAKMRSLVKVLLKIYRYPPDKSPDAINMVVEQAELFADDWAVDISAA